VSDGAEQTPHQTIIEAARLAIWQYREATGKVLPDGLATELVRSFVTITPPEIVMLPPTGPPPGTIGMIVMATDWQGGGTSRKPGNILLDLRKLTKAISEGALGVVSIPGAPWAAVFLAAALVVDVQSMVNVPLSEREAAILWTMWEHHDQFSVDGIGLRELVNAELRRHGRQGISSQELDQSLRILERIGCIEAKRGDHSIWHLTESITVRLP
jgi:hypothetical protein